MSRDGWKKRQQIRPILREHVSTPDFYINLLLGTHRRLLEIGVKS